MLLGLAVMGKYKSKLLMLFNLVFLMKCNEIELPFTLQFKFVCMNPTRLYRITFRLRLTS